MRTNSIWTRPEAEHDPVLELSFVQEFIRLCEDGFRMRFHERNGGNLSYWLTPEDIHMLPQRESTDPWNPLESVVPELGGEIFLITVSGSCFRNIAWAPLDNLCMIRLDAAGRCWQRIWGLRKGGHPTSELESHLMNFAIRSRNPERMCRVMYHAHPEHVIALSNLLPTDSRIVTRALWSGMIECAFLFPYGVGVVERMIPGGARISGKTAEMMDTHDAVLWVNHGLFCPGKDFDAAFGLMEAIDKSAAIQLQLLSAGKPQPHAIPETMFLEIARMLGGKMRLQYVWEENHDLAGK